MKRLFNEFLPVVPAGKWAGVFLGALALLLLQVLQVPMGEPAAAAGGPPPLVRGWRLPDNGGRRSAES